jgi:ATP-dependent Clp protease protease subunit
MAEEKQNQNGMDNQLIDKMLETRSILISGEIDKALAERVVRHLLLLEAAGDQPIKIFIDSPGGDADAGYAIFDMVRFIKPQVIMIGMGLVASAAALILLAAPKEQRLSLPKSNYLIHEPLSTIRGVATEIEIHARQLEKLRNKINQLISHETGVDLTRVEKDTDRDCWLDADGAKDYGLISRIISNRMDLESI